MICMVIYSGGTGREFPQKSEELWEKVDVDLAESGGARNEEKVTHANRFRIVASVISLIVQGMVRYQRCCVLQHMSLNLSVM